MDRSEARVQALRLAVEYYRGKDVSITTLEVMTDHFYKYITSGRM